MNKVKNPVREHGASSMEKAIYLWGLIANGRRWSAPKPIWPFIPAPESGTFWLFHVIHFLTDGYVHIPILSRM
jgi:hypothetical protein